MMNVVVSQITMIVLMLAFVADDVRIIAYLKEMQDYGG